MEVADLLGASSLELTLDMRQHATQSLLMPGLAGFQGASGCGYALCSLMASTDLADVSRLELTLDMQQHATQSLLLPGLAELQGALECSASFTMAV
jgi:hypothetical protein